MRGRDKKGKFSKTISRGDEMKRTATKKSEETANLTCEIENEQLIHESLMSHSAFLTAVTTASKSFHLFPHTCRTSLRRPAELSPSTFC